MPGSRVHPMPGSRVHPMASGILETRVSSGSRAHPGSQVHSAGGHTQGHTGHAMDLTAPWPQVYRIPIIQGMPGTWYTHMTRVADAETIVFCWCGPHNLMATSDDDEAGGLAPADAPINRGSINDTRS
jgi:hypothetical protein